VCGCDSVSKRLGVTHKMSVLYTLGVEHLGVLGHCDCGCVCLCLWTVRVLSTLVLRILCFMDVGDCVCGCDSVGCSTGCVGVMWCPPTGDD
jgi:hypothetical protein